MAYQQTAPGPWLPRQRRRRYRTSALPGFGLTLGYSIMYLSLVVLIPLSSLFIKSATLGASSFWETVTAPRVLAAFRLSFGASLLAAIVNVLFGIVVAWVLARYRFPGRRLLDGLVDLPFALPTAVAGITLTTVYAPNGWLGHWLDAHGVRVDYTPLGVFIALIFTGLPFVIRTVQPVLDELDAEIEEAAASLGASRWQTLRRVIWPAILPSAITGFALALSRAVGEYGSVIFISGNLPMRTEIVPLLIVSKLEEYNYAGATALAVVMLAASFSLLFVINVLQAWTMRRSGDRTV